MENLEEKLNILVVEDTLRHQYAARELLKEYNVTIVDNYKDAMFEISKGVGPIPEHISNVYGGTGTLVARELSGYDERINYDILLTDLFIPAGSEWNNAEEIPMDVPQDLGLYVAQYGLKVGIPHVNVLSDLNHHSNPQSEALADYGLIDSIFSDSGIKFVNFYDQHELDGIEEGIITETDVRKDGIPNYCVKNWGKLVDEIIQQKGE